MMKFFIVDDSIVIRAMLTEIIESEGLGNVVGEAEDGIEVTAELLNQREVDFLLIDFLMKKRDGLETIREISPHFKGKILLISQVDQKDTVAEAYLLGIAHYITKPINKYEVISVIQNEIKHYLHEKSITHIQESIVSLTGFNHDPKNQNTEWKAKPQTISKAADDSNQNIHKLRIGNHANAILMELGIIGESGCYDLIHIVEFLFERENDSHVPFQFPSLKQLFEQVALANCKSNTCDPVCIRKEAKATEQRVRRAVHHALDNLASIGLTDYGNPTFENYAAKLFDFTQLRMKMLELDGKQSHQASARLNIKKFIEVLYMEAKEANLEHTI